MVNRSRFSWVQGAWYTNKGFILFDALICVIVCSVTVMLVSSVSTVKNAYNDVYHMNIQNIDDTSLECINALEPWETKEAQPTSTP